jgi:mono/diheme cytochrome c family protein
MRTFIRRAAYTLAGLVVLIACAVGALYVVSQRRISARLDVAGHQLAVPADSATVARGEHVVRAIGMCAECHLPDLGGGPFIDVPVVARLWAANLTSGEGGVGAAMTDLEWERAIRHGVARDGRRLLYMPSHEYAMLNDADAAAMIAYLKQVPRVNRQPAPQSVGPVGRALFLKGDFELLPSELIDQAAPHPAVIAPAPTAEYGKYLTTTCSGCHGKTFSGGPIPGTPPEFRAPTNITPAGIGHYTEADFVRALRQGVRPGNVPLDTMYMPVRATKHLTDDELHAIWLYLQTVAPKEYGGR